MTLLNVLDSFIDTLDRVKIQTSSCLAFLRNTRAIALSQVELFVGWACKESLTLFA